jgi:hypothetical protein
MDKKTLKAISEIADELKKDMLKLFPDCSSTIMITVWEDGDYSVHCRYGDGEVIHILHFQKSVAKVEYIVEPFLSNAVKTDKFGNKYYIPDELIRYLI